MNAILRQSRVCVATYSCWDVYSLHAPFTCRFGLNVDVEVWSQQISFLLVGVLIVLSVRNLLIQLTKLFHFFASSSSGNFIVLFMSQVMVRAWRTQ